MKATIDVNELWERFGQTIALAGLSFIEPGSLTGIGLQGLQAAGARP